MKNIAFDWMNGGSTLGVLAALALSCFGGCAREGGKTQNPAAKQDENTTADKDQKSSDQPSDQPKQTQIAAAESSNPAASKHGGDQPAPDNPPSLQNSTNAKPAGSQPVISQPVYTKPSSPTNLFENWPKPTFALMFTGRQHGYIEPCGCTGLDNQKGGLARRHTLAQQLQKQGWPLALFDVGNQVRRYGRQPEIKFQMTVEGLKKIGYQAVGFGPDDLRLSSGELFAVAANDDRQNPSLFVGANVAILDREFTDGFRVVEVGGKKIGVTAVLGDSRMPKINSDELILTSAVEGLQAIWPRLRAKNCDLYVLLAYATVEETRQLARKFPGFQLVVISGLADLPSHQPEKIDGVDSLMIQVGGKGMYAAVVGVYETGQAAGPKASWPRGQSDQANEPIRFQRVPLDSGFADSRDMLNILKAYQVQLEAAGLSGLGLKPIKHPSGHQFVGSEKCAECHETAYEIWKKTPHARATEPLVHPHERAEIPRHFDPECLSCHVTGWNPQEYFPYESGYVDLKKSAHLHGNGCENCHGPGSAHVAAESGDIDASDELKKKLYEQMRLPLATAERKCLQCHDLDNDPHYHEMGKEAFNHYWQQIKHYEEN